MACWPRRPERHSFKGHSPLLKKSPRVDDFVEQLRGSKGVDSQGSFSIDRDRALRLMAEKSLPFPYAWLVALGQAVFHSGSPKLEVKLTRLRVDFKFRYTRNTTSEEMERTFLDPTADCEPAWQRLRKAVWGAALGEGREVSLTLGERRFDWSKGQMTVGPLPQTSGTEACFSAGLKTTRIKTALWKTVAALRARTDLTSEIKLRFFASPFQVTLDGVRVDGLHRNPGNGFSPRNRPFSVFWLQGEDPLTLPPAQSEGWEEPYPNSPLQFLSRGLKLHPSTESVAGAVLLTAHASTGLEHGSSGDVVWSAHKRPSTIYWVRQGATVGKEILPWGKLSVSLALVLSADNLRSDLTGFGLEQEGRKQRRLLYLKQIKERLEGFDWDPALADLDSRSATLKKSVGSMVLGLVGLPFTHGATFILVAAGVAGVVLNSGVAGVQRTLVRDYAKLRERLDRE